jgi:Na+/H+-dicarboxylate symporter
MFTVILSGIAACIALLTTNILKPGAGLVFDKAALAANQGVLSIAKNAAAAQDKPWFQYIVDLLPQNPIDSAARAFSGEIIAMMVFALFFGWALSTVIKDEEHPLPKVLDAIFQATMKIIEVAMKLAPYAIFGIVFNTSYRMGAGFLGNVAYFAFVVILGLLLQFFVVYSIFLATIGKTNPLPFFKQCREVYLYAFSTASSNATLPIALKCATDVLKIPPRIARFVITVGASANQNGSGLYEGVVVLFMAQVFGIDLTVGQQIQVVLMSMLAGVGTAGIPGGSLPLIVVLMINVGVPAEGIGLILGVDRFLDMCRTTLNVAGDLVIAKLVTESVDHVTLAAMHDTPESGRA